MFFLKNPKIMSLNCFSERLHSLIESTQVDTQRKVILFNNIRPFDRIPGWKNRPSVSPQDWTAQIQIYVNTKYTTIEEAEPSIALQLVLKKMIFEGYPHLIVTSPQNEWWVNPIQQVLLNNMLNFVAEERISSKGFIRTEFHRKRFSDFWVPKESDSRIIGDGILIQLNGIEFAFIVLFKKFDNLHNYDYTTLIEKIENRFITVYRPMYELATQRLLPIITKYNLQIATEFTQCLKKLLSD